jgi:carboxyl-terminal processing protease
MERRLWIVVVLALGIGLGNLASVAPAEESKKQVEDDYELYKIFADTMDQVERNYVKDISRRELMEAAIQGVLNKLDPYSNYISPDDIGRFKSTVESQFGGIGIQIGIENGQLKVISPLVGTPAYRAGLQAGDRILEINGKSTTDISIDEAVKQLKGEAGTKVALIIQHPASIKKEPVSITREWVHIETVLGDHREPNDAWDFMLDHDRKIGYVRISAFSRDTAADLKKALVELSQEGLRGLIVDLRFNPGGLLTSAIEVSDLFIPDGKIVSTKGRNTAERTWDAEKEGTFEGFPMAVLVNHYSASASEIFSACMQDHKRAVVIGERTWGKGSVQNVIELEGGKSALKLTTASYFRPSGKNIHRFPDSKEGDEWGVMPDAGFELALNRSQTEDLIMNRRDRDIVTGHHGEAEGEDPDAVASEDAPATETESNEQPAEEAKSDTDAKPAETKPAESKPADDAKPEASEPETPATDEPKAEEPKDKAGESEPAESKPDEATEPAADIPEHAEKKPDSKSVEKTMFVDLQLQKAIDYLTQEIARAD